MHDTSSISSAWLRQFKLKPACDIVFVLLTRHVFRDVRSNTVSNSWSDLSCHSSLLTVVLFARFWTFLAIELKGRILIIAQLTRLLDQRALQSRKWQLIDKSQWCCSANCGYPIARVNLQLDPRYAASKHTTAPINRTRPSPRKHSPDVATRARKQTSDYSLLLSLSTLKGWKAEFA